LTVSLGADAASRPLGPDVPAEGTAGRRRALCDGVDARRPGHPDDEHLGRPLGNPDCSATVPFMSAAVKKSGSAGSLKGLTRVGLGVEDVPGGLRDEGLTDDEVRQIARDRLSGSVQLLSPTLGLEIAPAESEQGPFAYTVSLELVQGVSVKRIREEDAKRVKAPTWRAQSVLPAGDLASLREAIGAVADAFAEDLSE